MQGFIRQDSFDLAINVFTSFGYFDGSPYDIEAGRLVAVGKRPD